MDVPDPETNDELKATVVSFPRLQPDTQSACPVSDDEIQQYLRHEDADGESVARRELRFIRTALVEETKYWIWDYQESDGEQCYVTVAERAGKTMLGMNGNWDALSPEQFILGDYRQMF
jgi:hypothetical protein